ncbi:MAG: DUF4199 domain-containing protein [Chlorobi bacterium]|nr:MAG: DUF4199 domain-containing protein [Bacteroidota bacterium]KXK34065.1 MAG: hypothetical protein UZ06_CHB003001467 [Chlorobi bacterium OLB6]MBE2265133.1 DUF4199 domain-containing protein [Flavobacteriales bacterium]MBL1161350.1 DUF4199 domain-containing protein [Chlorobiota bacterium]MBW7852637.1 DUF4199 domain-containing protein [Candidatus Kapabacteria bacterium]MCC6331103.1 DUF4199 domain-containing protein [Ignavibacteria bacterium]
MINLLWGGITGALGLLWLIMESALGRFEAGTSAEVQVLWLLLCPLGVIGAMVHRRLAGTTTPYGDTVRNGMYASVYGSLALCVVWLFFYNVLMPDYLEVVLRGTELKYRHIISNQEALRTVLSAKAVTLSAPMIYILGTLIPLVTGSVTAAIAAIWLRNRR